MKKRFAIIAALSMALTMLLSGCSFNVGSSGGKEDYKDIFIDRYEEANQDNKYKGSMVTYNYSLPGYGEMMIYVDTTEGHSFEVVQEAAGFKIKDKDGNDVLYGICLDKDMYAERTANCNETKTINGRDFIYVKNADGSEDCYTDVSDCGLNCGLALEIHDGNFDNFRLVAFR